jgi:hypothetical protein
MSEQMGPSVLDELRDELGAQFARLPAAPKARRAPTRRGLALVVAAILLVPIASALGHAVEHRLDPFQGQYHEITIEKHGRAEVDGVQINCSADHGRVTAVLGFDPCGVLQDTSAPAMVACPGEVRGFLRSLDYDVGRLDEYEALSGYPFESCPTADELRKEFPLGEPYFGNGAGKASGGSGEAGPGPP